MLRLNLQSGPEWLDLGHGVRLFVLPCTTSIMLAVRSSPEVEDLAEDATPEQKAIVGAKALARMVITDWEGVGDEHGEPVPVSPEAIDALMENWVIFEAFQIRYVSGHLALEQEKNG